ncbi:type II toxin-antitoxin system YoeB family toxin [Streptomyces sp. S1A]|uniref:type II toxin-antitoxin system YoeB family toxin n=1 Tax=Streptomyces sp. ICN903 TaxID=2964654 RepID=UPI001EDAC459|nr:type II toxin-antitoxin system YoeB family toxin [Streptomyces sp. ICN903]MCG3039735.1 type II toxin-antitoxin system YoeB family toxin [Streptomyces sp. ICN903]
MKVVFTEHGRADYVHWSETDRRMTRRVNRLVHRAGGDELIVVQARYRYRARA